MISRERIEHIRQIQALNSTATDLLTALDEREELLADLIHHLDTKDHPPCLLVDKAHAALRGGRFEVK